MMQDYIQIYFNNKIRLQTMLSDRKQNEADFSRVLESNRKSSSTCKQILRQICQDNQYSQLHKKSQSKQINSINQTTIKEIKLREAVSFLQKKSDKQNEELIFLTDQISKMKKQREQDLEFLKSQKEKAKRMQTTINNQAKTIADLKKKNELMQNGNKDFHKKAAQFESKILKLKELLRKKEIQIVELQQKTDSHTNFDKMLNKQKQELMSMRQNYFRIKSKQDDIEEENKRLKEKIEQLTQQKNLEKEKVWGLEEINKRLEDQCSELEQIYQESKKESEEVQSQLRVILEEQTNEITRLRDATAKIQQIEAGNDTETSVYWKQIVRILKQNVHDRGLKMKLQRQIQDVVVCMQQSWNKILMQVVATTVSDDL